MYDVGTGTEKVGPCPWRRVNLGRLARCGSGKQRACSFWGRANAHRRDAPHPDNPSTTATTPTTTTPSTKSLSFRTLRSVYYHPPWLPRARSAKTSSSTSAMRGGLCTPPMRPP
jgi:hypothetical protein